MMKKKFLSLGVILVIVWSAMACNPGGNELPNSDTGKTASGLDSMPIVNRR
jgi:hypothetical protein